MFRRSFLKVAALCFVIPALDWTRPERVTTAAYVKDWQGSVFIWCGAGEVPTWNDPANWEGGNVPGKGETYLTFASTKHTYRIDSK